jgi:hypothetical protein
MTTLRAPTSIESHPDGARTRHFDSGTRADTRANIYLRSPGALRQVVRKNEVSTRNERFS